MCKKEKVGISIQVPNDLKIDFDSYCDDLGISMTKKIISLMKFAINRNNDSILESSFDDELSLIQYIDKKKSEISSLEDCIHYITENGDDPSNYFQEDKKRIMDYSKDLRVAKLQFDLLINSLEKKFA